jgi:nitrate reductase gamma subunit
MAHFATAILTLMAGIVTGLAAAGLWLRRLKRRELTSPGEPPEPPDIS